MHTALYYKWEEQGRPALTRIKKRDSIPPPEKLEFLAILPENPAQVLAQIYQTQLVFAYRGIAKPIDSRYPNGVQGFVIEATDEVPEEDEAPIERGFDFQRWKAPVGLHRELVDHRKALGDAVRFYLFDPLLAARYGNKSYLIVRDKALKELECNDPNLLNIQDLIDLESKLGIILKIADVMFEGNGKAEMRAMGLFNVKDTSKQSRYL